jgi:hypothetical protein
MPVNYVFYEGDTLVSIDRVKEELLAELRREGMEDVAIDLYFRVFIQNCISSTYNGAFDVDTFNKCYQDSEVQIRDISLHYAQTRYRFESWYSVV